MAARNSTPPKPSPARGVTSTRTLFVVVIARSFSNSSALSECGPGSVIIDLAAERGGNCELTRADQVVRAGEVTVLGPTNVASALPYHASQMYAKNVTTFLLSMVKKGELTINTDDEVVRETLVTRNGEIVHPRVRQGHGLPAAAGTAGA
jgi:NAD(P) transhydrogenase subunit alpha